MLHSPVWHISSKLLIYKFLNRLCDHDVDFKCIGKSGAVVPEKWHLEVNMSVNSNKCQQEQGLTAYRSQITFANTSTLNDDLHKCVHWKNSRVLKDIAREGVFSVFSK